ncbi:hypothetical protein [Glycomyces paridis]|uniref:Uncharacterized protein n=1 Tax=Glycomyces paridis TaxID=2126555 RepID=A0A4S8P972_9ACTN|nr:hypothetical protein [Glycomyces paridis]THV26793.1 hypothetical protein E9998_17565 [Glycomyces paridis]
MAENRAIEPDSLNQAARLLFDLADSMGDDFPAVGDAMADAAEQGKEALPESSNAIGNLNERWTGYESKDMRENATTFAEYLAVFAADATEIEEYTAADFLRVADPELFGSEQRAAAVDEDSVSTTYQGPV